MTEISLVIAIAFVALTGFTAAEYWIRRRTLREELEALQQHLAHQEERMAAMRRQLDELSIEYDLVEQEKHSLQARTACMRALDRFDVAGGARTATSGVAHAQ